MAYKYPSLRTTLPVAGYYARLDAGAAATDQFTADGSQNGTLTNGATRVDDAGLAYSFDGSNDYIGLGNNFNSTIVGTSAKFTLSAWIKLTSSGDCVVFSKYGDSSHSENSRQMYVSVVNGKVTFIWSQFTTLTNARLLEVTSSSIVGAGWTHVAVTFDATVSTINSKAAIWINGTSQSFNVVFSAGSPTSIGTSTARAAIGAAIGASSAVVSYPFAGLIDDVLLYPYVLPSPDIGYLASQRGAIYAELAASRRRSAQASIRSTF